MAEVSVYQDFGKRPFQFPDIVETSIGPVWLCFTDNEPYDPPMINAFDLCHWHSLLDLPQGHHFTKVQSKAEMHLSFVFKQDGGWQPSSKAPKIKLENVEMALPAHLQQEIASQISKWARDNQERFIRHERSQFFEQLTDYGEMLHDAAEDLPRNDEIEAIIASRWAQLVPPETLDMARQCSAAMAKIQDGVREAAAAFKAIQEAKPCSKDE